ncbi:hypothetical protein KY290_037841 [Solanum tuberosum]|uniref:DUF4283 domain-containing protein n=1 Tax=Solanum tuberosum TaxID=4113 RepID=A0ABQ7TWP5_SOLTU|nr:hypothetical protein KY284_037860 [Solanum tuberosum]KAH0739136.1 hypothetical protein KY290_037841 [Solanum tuberosum]
MEEGLHQALVFKFSQDPINMQEVRKLLPIQLGTQGRCLVGWLARRHILVRFDRYDDYVLAAAKTVQYLLYNGLQKQFRVFPWTIGFNPKEETSRAFVWISFPNLPPELFAKQSLLSIASAAGKPIAIDKATQDKSRPSTARVKVEIDLLANLPHRMRIQYVDQKTGKSVEQFQKFVYDNLPFYCNFCKHQGHNESECRLLLGNTAARNQEEASQVGSEIEKYQGKAVAHESASGDQSLTTRNTLVLESQHPLATNKTVDLALDPVNAKVVADGPQHDARGVETIECLVDNMMQQVDNANKRIESDVETNSIALMNAKSTGGGVELVHESNWAVVTKKKSPSIGIGSPISNTVQQVVDSQTINLGAREIVSQEVMCFNTFDALTNNFVHEINSSQVNSTNELVISKEKQGATSTMRWIDIADEEEEQVTSPPMQKKLSPTAPAFVPSSAKLVTPPQGLSPSTNVAAILSDRLVSSNIEKLASLAPININKQLQVGGSCTLSPNKFANLDDEDISEEGEEGEEGEEEEMLDYCFAIAARNADISPRQQRNNKTKHERKHSWDGKVTEEFVPRQLPMRLAKQNHMTISTTSTRFNKAKK